MVAVGDGEVSVTDISPRSAHRCDEHDCRVTVATDCVGDRALGPHESNLFDMGQKYADLLTGAEIVALLQASRA